MLVRLFLCGSEDFKAGMQKEFGKLRDTGQKRPTML